MRGCLCPFETNRIEAGSYCRCVGDPTQPGMATMSLFLPVLIPIASLVESLKEWRQTCIAAVSTQLTKCYGMGELPNRLKAGVGCALLCRLNHSAPTQQLCR